MHTMQKAKGLFLDKKGALSQIQVRNAQRVPTEADAAPMRLTRHPSRRKTDDQYDHSGHSARHAEDVCPPRSSSARTIQCL